MPVFWIGAIDSLGIPIPMRFTLIGITEDENRSQEKCNTEEPGSELNDSEHKDVINLEPTTAIPETVVSGEETRPDQQQK
jgi:hypothetical protein